MTLKTEKIHKNLDLLGSYLLNWGIQTLTADPATTYPRIYLNSVSDTFRVYNSETSAWSDLGTGSYTDEQAQDAVGTILTDTATIDFTYNDGAPSITADVKTGSITLAMQANISTDHLIGRDTAGSGVQEELAVSGGIEFTGSGGIQRSALTGDITASAGSNTTAIATGVIIDSDINASAAIAASKLAFTPADSIAATTVQNAIVEALTDARAYADSIASGVDWKPSVRAATTANITVATALNSGDVIDGVTLANGDRVLVKDQSSGSENGIYVVAASPARASDADASAEVTGGLAVWVNEGTTNADTGWILTTNDAITLDTTALVFTQFSGLGQITAGNALTKTGNTLDVAPGTGLEISSDTIRIAAAAAGAGLTGGAGSALAVGAGNGITVSADDVALASTAGGAGLTYTTGVLAVGAGTGITVNADDVAVDVSVVARKYAVDIGDNSTADIVVTHNLNTRDVIVAVREVASPYAAHDVYWEATTVNTVTIFFPTAPTTAELRAIVHG